MAESLPLADDAREAMLLDLLAQRSADGAWPYQAGGASSTEPTSLALLALSTQVVPAELAAARDWLAARQRDDGFLTVSPVHGEPSWVTPLAAMALARLGLEAAAARAADALLNAPVKTFGGALAASLYGYDTALPGWPWTVGDFSFVEPTALAVIFLKQRGHGASDRVRTAVEMLLDRAIPSGGWNYGEPEVLGGGLYPTAAPTALALLALADEPSDVTSRAVGWLESQRGDISGLFSLAWTCIALNIRGRPAQPWREDLIGLWNASGPPRRGPLETALSLLGLAARRDHPLRP